MIRKFVIPCATCLNICLRPQHLYMNILGSGKILSIYSHVRPSVCLSVEWTRTEQQRRTKFGHNICLLLEQYRFINKIVWIKNQGVRWLSTYGINA